jgi:hypothetical protein
MKFKDIKVGAEYAYSAVPPGYGARHHRVRVVSVVKLPTRRASNYDQRLQVTKSGGFGAPTTLVELELVGDSTDAPQATVLEHASAAQGDRPKAVWWEGRHLRRTWAEHVEKKAAEDERCKQADAAKQQREAWQLGVAAKLGGTWSGSLGGCVQVLGQDALQKLAQRIGAVAPAVTLYVVASPSVLDELAGD